MIILSAGAKPTTKSNPWEDPRVAAELNHPVMTTFFELGKMNDKKVKKFMKTFKKGKKV